MLRTLAVVLASWFVASTLVFAVDPAALAPLKARTIGPAAMSGRVAAIDVWERDPNFMLVGAATGGLWKSINAGLTWTPIFDDQPVHSVGAVRRHPDHPDVIWVGTGEGNPRNSASVGNGVYKSIDGGRSWRHLGLEKTERIHRLLLDPTDPDTVYAAAMGRMWGENPERGVFKTTDGGRTWSHVLAVDERTGCADLVMDPRNPQKLIAAMWDYRRWPWFFRSGGTGSGIHLTYDGGKSWRKLGPANGLPRGDLGRVGLAIAPSDPNIVYALIETKGANDLYRSEDGGESWRKVSSGDNVGNRPFYYADIRVDPQDPNRVYSLWSLVSVSKDGGKTFEILVNWNVHPDHHAMWINPNDPDHLVNGNDGGIAISRDRGKTWRFVRNLPLAQFYHVRVDNDVPYNIYGGLQDNGSWRGPSSVWENGGIRNHHWQEVAFGDGFDTVPDPRDSTRGYAMSQGGALMKWDLNTGLRKMIQPTAPKDVELRFNWNAAIDVHPDAPDTVYFGSQFVHRSRDGGTTWKIISEDLTTDDPQWQRQKESGGLTLDVTDAENFTSIVSLAINRLDKSVIWAGTDDGRLHVSRDSGESWTSVERNVPEVPRNTWIPMIAPSQHDSAVAYVVFDDHRRSNWTPYVFRTDDYGQSWSRLSIEGVRGYALSIAEDPIDRNLLFLGTEFGLYVSTTGGSKWVKFTHGVPTSSVMDLAIQGDEHDLVVATHGRGLFIVDDISALRGLDSARLASTLHLFPPRPAHQHWRKQPASSRFAASGEFKGSNQPYGALLTFVANRPEEATSEAKAPKAKSQKNESSKKENKGTDDGKLIVEIADAKGNVVRRFRRAVKPGLNRVTWDLRRDGFRRPSRRPIDDDADRPGGVQVVPGEYQVTLKFGGQSVTESLEVRADPRMEISADDRRANIEARERVGRWRERAGVAIRRIATIREDLGTARKKAEEIAEEERAPFDEAAKALEEALTKTEQELWSPPGGPAGIPAEESASSKLGSASWRIGSSWERPTPDQLALLDRAIERVAEAIADLDAVVAEEYAEFRRQIRELDLELAPTLEPLGG